MAFLIPDATYTTENGIVVNRKFLPTNLRPNRLLNTPDHKPEYITIHNTDDINEAAGTNDAEQYARATFNGNMNGVTVHFYIDETACWQIVPARIGAATQGLSAARSCSFATSSMWQCPGDWASPAGGYLSIIFCPILFPSFLWD